MPTHDRNVNRVLDQLEELQPDIAEAEAEVGALYAKRRKLWARGRTHGATFLQLADASGVSDTAVMKGLKK